jgi:hypothetical protein
MTGRHATGFCHHSQVKLAGGGKFGENFESLSDETGHNSDEYHLPSSAVKIHLAQAIALLSKKEKEIAGENFSTQLLRAAITKKIGKKFHGSNFSKKLNLI